jgi:hypothetical protein
MNSLGTGLLKIYQWRFDFPVRSVSFQQAKFGNGQVYKTDYQKAFIKEINACLMDFNVKVKLRQPEALFDPRRHILVGHWVFLYSDFFTKKDFKVNSKVPDLENGKKMIQDILFKSMNLNDKDICLSEDMKYLGDDRIIFVLKLMERQDFETILKEKIKSLL